MATVLRSCLCRVNLPATCTALTLSSNLNQVNKSPIFSLVNYRNQVNMTSYVLHMFQTDAEKEEALKALGKTNWSRAVDKDAVTKTFNFKNFVQAFSFMTAVALESEKIDHHPEWSNVYNRVEITLTSHFCKGVSLLDYRLATTIDSIYFNSAKD